MDPKLQQHVVFHLTGRRPPARLDAIDPLALRPALFARFNDLPRLRYDFPVVLAQDADADACVHTLSGLVDSLLKELAPPGIEGERLRRNALRLEREIRELLAGGARGTLGELWSLAADRLVARGGEPVQGDLARLTGARGVDGELLDCDGALPARLVTHAWSAVQRAKAQKARRDIGALLVRLSDLVKADYLRSADGRHADTLQAGIGSGHKGLFDFDAMARLIARPSGTSALPQSRRARIEASLAVLRAQRFFADGGHGFRFDDVDAASAAFRERLPQMAELVKAMSIAELEVEGRYVEARHDAFFDDFDAGSLRPEDFEAFPDYLVCQAAGGKDAPARARIIEALASGVPLKILLETGDILEEPSFGEGHTSLGAQIAGSAMGLNDAYVLQSAGSNLYRMRHRIVAAMRYAGPALISVFSGAGTASGSLPPYLLAAAAMQSRAFPAFTCDPSAGADWAKRFSLEGNPQPGAAWPLHDFSYADDTLQRVEEKLGFTFVDFVACDPRYARHFARVPRSAWNGSHVPVGDWLARAANGVPETVPCITAVDAEGTLQKLVVDEKLVHAARRCADAWRRLQELEGLKREMVPAPAMPAVAASPAPAAEKPAPAAAVEEPAKEDRPPGEPYIETARCSTCNECTNINNAMFAYNENKQAYIANADAGTYAQMVEAAESCQLSIIHPGKPRNPKEPGLEDLMKRAEAFP